MNKETIIKEILETLKTASAADCAVTLEFLQHLTADCP